MTAPSAIDLAGLAADEVNAAGGVDGRPIELVAVDSGRPPEVVAAEAATAAPRRRLRPPRRLPHQRRAPRARERPAARRAVRLHAAARGRASPSRRGADRRLARWSSTPPRSPGWCATAGPGAGCCSAPTTCGRGRCTAPRSGCSPRSAARSSGEALVPFGPGDAGRRCWTWCCAAGRTPCCSAWWAATSSPSTGSSPGPGWTAGWCGSPARWRRTGSTRWAATPPAGCSPACRRSPRPTTAPTRASSPSRSGTSGGRVPTRRSCAPTPVACTTASGWPARSPAGVRSARAGAVPRLAQADGLAFRELTGARSA